MNNDKVTRGVLVTFSVTFFDKDRNPQSPSGAEVRVAYTKNGVAALDVLAMSSVGNAVYVANWDSSVADAGEVSWHAHTLDGIPCAKDGEFVVFANAANPAPAG